MTNFNAKALANTARECASMANSVSGTIKSIVIHWNLCCQQAQMEGFTTEARYSRRAVLAADMLRMADQLDRIAEGCNPITGQTIDEAHAEALEMNAELNAEMARACREAAFFGGLDYSQRREVIEAAHAEALEINAAVDASLPAMASSQGVWKYLSEHNRKLALEAAHAEALEIDRRMSNPSSAGKMEINGIVISNVELFCNYVKWLGNSLTRDAQLIQHRCPQCDSTLFAPVPAVGDVWDSLSTCPVCCGTFFRVISNETGYPVVSINEFPQEACA